MIFGSYLGSDIYAFDAQMVQSTFPDTYIRIPTPLAFASEALSPRHATEKSTAYAS